MPIFNKAFRKTEEKGTLLTLSGQYYQTKTSQENYGAIFFINMNIKFLNKRVESQIHQHIK